MLLMNIALILITIIASYLLFKLLFVFAYSSFTERYLFKTKKDFIIFVLKPWLENKYSKDKYLQIYYYLSLLLAICWGLIFALSSNKLVDLFKINFTVALLYISSIIIFICFLLYLSIYDVISFSIPEIISKRMLLFAAFVNLLFLVLKILLSNTEFSYIFGLINLGSFSNLVGGIVGGGVIWLVVKISKEKAMGAGDVDILAAIGLMLGVPFIFYSFLYTLFSAAIISVIYVLIIRKFKGVLIPFVPFLSSGFMLCFLLTDSVIRLFSLY